MKINMIKLLTFLTLILSFQITYAKPNPKDFIQEPNAQVDAIITVKNAIISYTEINKNQFNEIKLDFNSGIIEINQTTNNKQVDKKTYSFDKDKQNINGNMLQLNTEFAFKHESYFSASNKSSCAGAAAQLLDMANRMIQEGRDTGNQALVEWGRVLQSMAERIFQLCMLQ